MINNDMVLGFFIGFSVPFIIAFYVTANSGDSK